MVARNEQVYGIRITNFPAGVFPAISSLDIAVVGSVDSVCAAGNVWFIDMLQYGREDHKISLEFKAALLVRSCVDPRTNS